MDRKQSDSIASTAQRLGVSERTIRRLIAAGKITGYRVGPRLIRVDPAEVDALLASGRIPNDAVEEDVRRPSARS